MKRRKKSLIFGIILLILCFGIGYAYLTTTLSINGTTDIDSNVWDVYFDNIVVTNGSVTGVQVIDDAEVVDDTTVSFHINLKEPGEFYEFTVDAKNDGTIDAMISSITKKVNGGTTIPAYLNYTVTYFDDLEIEDNHLLESESLETYKVRVEYRTDIDPDDLPSTAQSLTLSFDVEYVQSDNNASEVIHYVYTANFWDGEGMVYLGQPIPSGITQYHNIVDAYNAVNATTNNITQFYLKQRIQSRIVTESYVEFIITPEMVNDYPDLVPGKYTLRGAGATYNSSTHSYNDDSSYYESNKSILFSAMGDYYCTDFSSYVNCAGGYYDVYIYPYGLVEVSTGGGWNCTINALGASFCGDEL